MHPVRQVRAGVPARRDPREGLRPGASRGAPPTFKSRHAAVEVAFESRYTLQVAPEDCTGCTLCVEVCPVEDKTDRSHKALNMVALSPVRERERRTLGLLPHASGRAPTATCRCGSGQARPAAAAAVRVLRRVRRLRRNAVHQAADPAVRRSHRHRECHWLFVDLRRQSADDAVHRQPRRPGPAWANSLFEDNAEFGLGMRLAIDEQRRHAEALVGDLAPAIGEELAGQIPRARISRPRPASNGSARAWRS